MMQLNRYVKLITKRKLPEGEAKVWYQCVARQAPSGVVSAVATLDDAGNQHDVHMIHRETDLGHEYLVPISRDLSVAEIDKIVEAFADLMPERDFDVETHESKLLAKDHSEIPLDAAKHVALCTALSKHRHEEWTRERTSAGWRYGTKYSAKHKTHPLLRPWDQLPERYRVPDLSWPQKLVSMLNDYGYAVLHKEELDRLLAMLADAT
jgi:hypothetical protein